MQVRAMLSVSYHLSMDQDFDPVVSMHEPADLVVPEEAAGRGQILRSELSSANLGN